MIARIAANPNPKLRYLAGTDARLQLMFKTLAPWRIYERVVTKAMKID